jgi:predicted NAD/FAD-dependent oxidoreductase
METDILILGAGMAGLACARHLTAAGHTPLVIDKGRGVGGRMATRRFSTPGHNLSFDHGAQYFTTRNPAFSALIKAAGDSVARWEDGAGETRLVGCPGMTSFPRMMAEGLHVRPEVEVKSLRQEGSRWVLETTDGTVRTRRLVMTIPAPQAVRLLGAAHPASARLETVEMAPCLTLMAAFPSEEPKPFVSRASQTHPLAWIAQDSSKPGRNASATGWIAQASPNWSLQHLEETQDTIAPLMLALFAEVIGTDPGAAIHAAAHRWRYARVIKALGQPFLRSDDSTLWLGGDWCLGPRVEAAWESGDAIGRDVLSCQLWREGTKTPPISPRPQ